MPARSHLIAALATASILTLLVGCGVTASSARGTPTHTTNARLADARKRPALPWKSTAVNRYLPYDVLIADSNNNRILLVTPQKKIVWQFPKAGQPTPLYDDDDVFFGPHFDEIITNEESNDTIAIINFATEKVVWTYGHARTPGSAPGYLNTPDDAFLYDLGGRPYIESADIRNQRIIFIDRKTKRIVRQFGQTGVYAVNPPVTYGAPNGDFPAPHHGTLITQIGGDDAILVNAHGQVQWTLHFPSRFTYPSDANFTPNGNVIVVFYTDPGAIVEMTPAGKVVWQYAVQSGPGMLNHPSLGMMLPNGMVLLNDDSNDRVIVIDPKTDRIVWQYGHTGVPGSAPGYLNIPDGVDLLPAGIVPGGHNPIGGHLWSFPGNGY